MRKFLILCLAIIFVVCLVSCGESADSKNDENESDGYITKTENDAERLGEMKKQIEEYFDCEFSAGLVSVECGILTEDGSEPSNEYDFSKVHIEVEFEEEQDAAMLYECLINEGLEGENDMAKSKYELNGNVVIMNLEALDNN